MKTRLLNFYRNCTKNINQFPLHNTEPTYYTNFISNYNDQFQKGLWWGSYYKYDDTSYLDNSCVIQEDSGLLLTTKYQPKFNEHNNKTMNYARGCIMSREAYQYGAIEVVTIISPAINIWHAPLWFVAAGPNNTINVLPEVDVAEVYTKNNPYKAKAKTNIHYGLDYQENSKVLGAKTHYIPNIFNRPVSYGIIWNPNEIKLYYDGYLVRKVTKKSILSRLKYGMYPIINTSVQPNSYHNGSEMRVKSFKYWAM